MKKAVLFKILAPLISLVFLISIGVTILAGILGAVSSSQTNCTTEVATSTSTDSSISSGDGSIDSFVKEHKEAYILSWKAGGFLPSASITQTMIENGFNFYNPNGTSFWQAHNMGGVKTSSKSNFPVTLATYGEDSVDLTGTKPGANVGDGTGGAYTWFSSYDASIVGKAEFMAHQTLYTKAINNTDGIATLSAIADGGWATDGTYKTKLIDMYNTLGKKYEWLDKEAISAHGEKPYKEAATSPGDSGPTDTFTSSNSDEDCSDSSSSGSATDGTGTVPADATAWGYKPDDLPDSLKQYIIDPSKNGLTYKGQAGWVEHSGQCVDLTVSLGNQLWGGSGTVIGIGDRQASSWASTRFGNSTKTSPKRGAIFSTNAAANHTGIVCHVFEDGSILVVEQNTPLSGAKYGLIDTWNYRVVSPSTQKSDGFHYAYPDNKKPNIK
ncbi:CHAP domain-containing protein [Streptococcus pasteurianus]|nr:CHAP domain-containing protein [Streptococcus pasteurianus]